jgi:uncharacterized DUF497 family protein
MNDGRFQWDDEKGASNYAKHGVRFEAARDVFKDPFAIDSSMIVTTPARTALCLSAWRAVAC